MRGLASTKSIHESPGEYHDAPMEEKAFGFVTIRHLITGEHFFPCYAYTTVTIFDFFSFLGQAFTPEHSRFSNFERSIP